DETHRASMHGSLPSRKTLPAGPPSVTQSVRERSDERPGTRAVTWHGALYAQFAVRKTQDQALTRTRFARPGGGRTSQQIEKRAERRPRSGIEARLVVCSGV